LKKKQIILLVAMLLVVAAAAGVGLIRAKVTNIEKQLDEIVISDVDLTQVANGTYKGSCSVFPVSVEVSVTVKDHAIIAIELDKHEHGQGAAAEVIADRVVEAQSLLVDTISSATYSSKVILKAIENALAVAQ